MIDMIFDFYNFHRIAATIISILIYLIIVFLIYLLVRKYYKKHYGEFPKKTKHNSKSLVSLTSYDLFPKNEQLKRMQIVSSKLGRVNHRIFSTSIFTTIRNGLKDNEKLSHISDCDERNDINV